MPWTLKNSQKLSLLSLFADKKAGNFMKLIVFNFLILFSLSGLSQITDPYTILHKAALDYKSLAQNPSCSERADFSARSKAALELLQGAAQGGNARTEKVWRLTQKFNPKMKHLTYDQFLKAIHVADIGHDTNS
jgi:hypothetical protein